jgi:serine/threonine-protein kinase
MTVDDGVGLVLGDVTLSRLLGRGAMGSVYLGQTVFGTSVAVKVLRSELAEDPSLLAQIVQESSALTRLKGPHIVALHRLVAEGGVVGLVMDYLAGGDARRLLREHETLAPARACALLTSVLEALARAHENNIVHCDVKPENVLIGADGEGYLADFGIARVVDGSVITRLTGFVGTPSYMAPETLQHGETSSAVDIYAARRVRRMSWAASGSMPPRKPGLIGSVKWPAALPGHRPQGVTATHSR